MTTDHSPQGLHDKLDALLAVVRRTETRLCLLAQHMGATHVGAPPQPGKALGKPSPAPTEHTPKEKP